jgi:hypothetical protein
VPSRLLVRIEEKNKAVTCPKLRFLKKQLRREGVFAQVGRRVDVRMKNSDLVQLNKTSLTLDL